MNVFTEHVHVDRSGQREITRHKVLASAERLFREQGFAATTIRQIAADAEVSNGTVMNVGDKHSLLIAIFDNWIATVHRSRATTITGADLRDPSAVAEAVMSIFEPFIDYFASDQDLAREYAAVIVRGTHRSEIFHSLAAALKTEIEAALDRSPLAPEAVATSARVIYFCYLGVLMTVANGAISKQAATDQLHEMIHLVAPRERAQQ